jgi:LemA protein
MTGIGSFLFTLVFVVGFGFSFLGFTGGIIVTILYFLGALIYSCIKVYNKMKSEQIKISEARSNIGVYLQQRYDEISAMYKIVQEYKLHEIGTFKEIVQLRQMAMSDEISFKEKTEINNEIEGRLPTLMATFENYPELRSNENFLQLQEAISDNESNISSARKSYNGYINKYNTTIAMFPTVLFAKMFNFGVEELYEAPMDRRENPLL